MFQHIFIKFQIIGDIFRLSYQSALSHPLFRKCHFLKFLGEGSYITTEDMKFILKNFNLKYGFLTRSLRRTKIDIKLLVNIPRLDFEKSPGLTLDDLKMMNCEKMRFYDLNTIKAREINKYIRYWLDGNLPNLRRLQLNYWWHHWAGDLLYGLPYSKWNPKRRARIFCDDLEFVDCSYGRDIERSDGLLATILIENFAMYFLVWHDRFPTDPRTLFHFSNSVSVPITNN